MQRRRLSLVLAVSLALIGPAPLFRRIASGAGQGPNGVPGQIRDAVKQAKAKGQTEITMPAQHFEYPGFDSLEEALTQLTLVYARLEAKLTVISLEGDALHTYLRFSAIQKLTQQASADKPMPSFVPQELRQLRDHEFIMSMPSAGEMVIDGVHVRSGNRRLQEFVAGQGYLLFVDLGKYHGFGGLAFGLDGAFEVDRSGLLRPLQPDGSVASEFKRLSLTSLSKVVAEVHARAGSLREERSPQRH